MVSRGRFSCVIATWNRPTSVRVAIQSALNQCNELLEEVIVVDDGSEPPIRSYLGEEFSWSSRVKLIEIPHSGLSRARNIGIESAKGEFVAFLDDDDMWNSDHLKTLAAMIGCGGDGALYGVIPEDLLEPRSCDRLPQKYLFSFNPLPPSGVAIPKGMIEAVSGFEESDAFSGPLMGYSDHELWIRLGLVGPIYVEFKGTWVYGKDGMSARQEHKDEYVNFVRSMITRIYRKDILELVKAGDDYIARTVFTALTSGSSEQSLRDLVHYLGKGLAVNSDWRQFCRLVEKILTSEDVSDPYLRNYDFVEQKFKTFYRSMRTEGTRLDDFQSRLVTSLDSNFDCTWKPDSQLRREKNEA